MGWSKRHRLTKQKNFVFNIFILISLCKTSLYMDIDDTLRGKNAHHIRPIKVNSIFFHSPPAIVAQWLENTALTHCVLGIIKVQSAVQGSKK